MSVSEIILILFSSAFIAGTFASVIRRDDWWIRVFDFPRIQISISLIVLIVLSVLSYSFRYAWHFYLLGLLVLSIGYQFYRIFPYTILAKKQVHRSKGGSSRDLLSVLVSNVKQSNRQSGKLIDRVKEATPDLLLTLETNLWWEEQLSTIEKDYPYTVKIPQDNRYGMHFFSKLKLSNVDVKYQVAANIPSIEACVELKNGESVRIFCLHPRPPSPTEAETSTNRDAELLLVAEIVDVHKETLLVFGDLNDVAWSKTTTLFLKTSRLLDPRRGRGFFNTFHAGNVLLRWPLDHIFHSDDFKLITMKRLKSIGSDHFPIYTKLHYQPGARKIQEKAGPPDEEEREWKEEKKDRALN